MVPSNSPGIKSPSWVWLKCSVPFIAHQVPVERMPNSDSLEALKRERKEEP